MVDTGSESGQGSGPGRRGRLFDDLAGLAGGAFSMAAGLRSEIESMARSQIEMMVQRLELVRREDLDAALEVARRAREEANALSARVAALEAKLGSGAASSSGSGATAETAPPDVTTLDPLAPTAETRPLSAGGSAGSDEPAPKLDPAGVKPAEASKVGPVPVPEKEGGTPTQPGEVGTDDAGPHPARPA